MHMTHVCFYVCCRVCVGACGNVGSVMAVVEDSVFFAILKLSIVIPIPNLAKILRWALHIGQFHFSAQQ